jgi:MFS transporter, DHA1 family, inner membrane transport protein
MTASCSADNLWVTQVGYRHGGLGRANEVQSTAGPGGTVGQGRTMEGLTIEDGSSAREVLYGRRPRAAIAAVIALGTGAFCFVTTENLPVGLLSVISAHLHVSVSAVGLLVTAYASVVAIASAPLTHLTKRVTRRVLVCVLLATFVLTNLASAAAASYWWLLGARVATAVAQAVFWSIIAVTAVGLFPPRVRAKVVAGVMGSGSLAVVIGVPFGTWLGQRGGWRLPFVVLSCVGFASLVAVALLLPTADPAESHAAVGSSPDRRRYRLLVIATVLFVTGAFTSYTYITALLTRVSGLHSSAVAPVLLLAGGCGAVGVATTGALFDKYPRFATVGPVALLAASLGALYAFATNGPAAIACEAFVSLSIGAFVISNQNRVLIVAPGSTDVASAWASAFFNAGIAGGSLSGGVVLASLGVRATALTGAVFGAAALAAVLSGHLGASRPAAAPAPPRSRGDQELQRK